MSHHYIQKNTPEGCFGISWSGRQDSNLRPSAPKADALPNCATSRFYLARPTWVEHVTFRFVVWRSIQLSYGRKVCFRRISPFGGSYRNRTDGDWVAVNCLTTWLRNHRVMAVYYFTINTRWFQSYLWLSETWRVPTFPRLGRYTHQSRRTRQYG